MSKTRDELNPLSELFAVSTSRTYKNLAFGWSELRGRLELEAMEAAFRVTVDRFPRMMSGVKQIWSRGRFSLVWEFRPHLKPALNIHNLSAGEPNIETWNDIYERLESLLERGPDPFNGVTTEFHLVRISAERHIIAVILHHCAGDAIYSSFFPTLLANYHKAITKELPSWAAGQIAFFGEKKNSRPIEEHPPTVVPFREKWFPWPKPGEFGHIAGSGSNDDHRQYCRRTTFSEDQTRRIVEAARALRTTSIDYLTACVHLTVERWNNAMNQETGILSTAHSINLSARRKDLSDTNTLGQIFLQTTPDQRASPSSTLRLLQASRLTQQRNSSAELFHDAIRRGRMLAGPFPLDVKRSLGYFLLHTLQWGVAAAQINYFGVAFPKSVDGRPTGESFVHRGHELEMTDIFLLAYKTFPRAPIQMWIYTYRNRLSLVLAARGRQFTADEVESFTNLLAECLLEYPLD